MIEYRERCAVDDVALSQLHAGAFAENARLVAWGARLERHRRRGIGRELVTRAVRIASDAGCTWLHADFAADLTPFYLDSCGLAPTAAGLVRLHRP